MCGPEAETIVAPFTQFCCCDYVVLVKLLLIHWNMLSSYTSNIFFRKSEIEHICINILFQISCLLVISYKIKSVNDHFHTSPKK